MADGAAAAAAAGLGIRWTVGDVSPRGFEALRLSVWGAWRLFGPEAAYAICVNAIPVEEARARTGEVPPAVAWRPATDIPAFLRPFLDAGMAEGVAWKFAPLRLFPDRHELALDNDCILWAMPRAISTWLQGQGDGEPQRCVLAEDVAAGFGRFANLCGPEPRNTGIRGLPPGFDLEAALRAILDLEPAPLVSELDEQGLQVAALSRGAPPLVVTLDEVTVCSPFHPHLPHLGRCGAHFVGLNARDIPWTYYDRPAIDCRIEHWAGHADALYRTVGLPHPGGGVTAAPAGGPPAR